MAAVLQFSPRQPRHEELREAVASERKHLRRVLTGDEPIFWLIDAALKDGGTDSLAKAHEAIMAAWKDGSHTSLPAESGAFD